METRLFVMAGGGTGGHVMPLLAVARELARRGHQVLFIGTHQGLEARLVPEAGFSIEWIEIGGMQRVGWRRALRTALQLPPGIARCWRILQRTGARVVFSLGGYVAGPVVSAAMLRGIPVVLMEPNAIPGLVNRAGARMVYRALLGLPDAAAFFPPGRSEVTGVPVRDEFFALPPKAPAAELAVLITGGSRGSRTLNRAFRESWPLFRAAGAPLRFLHQSGEDEAEPLSRDFLSSGLQGEVRAFISDMPAAFAASDLVVGRSGAGAVAELAAAGKASLLVPFPFAADNHQQKNAEAMVRAGAARMALDAEMNGHRLFQEVMSFVNDRAALQRMNHAAGALARPGAARRAAEVLELAAQNPRKRVDSGAESRKNTNNIVQKCF
jgi:UDP-N-acetylglucosamine--N-acetylmuramyl-(pentapeptide) pyrophosphoryl-undecaprenol N-acetylglucosamine transferase